MSDQIQNAACAVLPMHKEFAVHMLTEDGKYKAKVIAEAFNNCLHALERVCAEGREMAIVKTKLEEACFFAKKSMAQKNCQ
jgi:hypothetical protein